MLQEGWVQSRFDNTQRGCRTVGALGSQRVGRMAGYAFIPRGTQLLHSVALESESHEPYGVGCARSGGFLKEQGRTCGTAGPTALVLACVRFVCLCRMRRA